MLPVALFAEPIPANRRIAWDPGVRGGIPNYPNQINVKDSPYNAKGDGSTNDTSAIQSAINACSAGNAVFFPAGTYVVTSTLSVSKGIVLRGAGPDSSTIKYTSSSGSHIIDCGRAKSAGSNLAISGSPTLGTQTLTLSSTSGLAQGDFIVMTELNPSYVDGKGASWLGNDDSSRLMAQMNQITALNGNVVTLYHPLYWDLSSSLSPRVNEVALLTGVGIEDLGIWRSNSASQGGCNILFRYMADSWIRNVHSQYSGQRHIEVRNSLRCTVRDSFTDNSNSVASDKGYHYYCWGWNSDHLFENNIAYRARHSLVFEGGGSGVVFGYNYSVDPISDPDRDWLTEDLDTHGSHPFMNLFEGNIVSHFVFDYTWGSSSHNTVFRSQAQIYSGGLQGGSSFMVGVDIEKANYYINIVGCVLGRLSDSASGKTSYRYGYTSPGGSSSDSQSKATSYVHGNYSIVEKATVWDSTNSDHTLPASLYLTAKPSWWGSSPWPAIGPDLTPMVSKIPAQIRHEGGGSPPPAPSELQAQQPASP